MYLVEIETGREQLYDSVAALASAIRRGDVGSQSRIFHRASSSWVSITVHPEFKKATAARESQPTATDGDPADQASAKSGGSRRGWRGILGRALRHLSPASKTSELSGS